MLLQPSRLKARGGEPARATWRALVAAVAERRCAAQVIDVLHPGRANVPKVRHGLGAAGRVHAAAGRARCAWEWRAAHSLAGSARRAPAGRHLCWPPAARRSRRRRRAQAELKEKLEKMYNAKDVSAVFVFGFRTQVRPALARVRRIWRRSCCDTQLSLPSPACLSSSCLTLWAAGGVGYWKVLVVSKVDLMSGLMGVLAARSSVGANPAALVWTTTLSRWGRGLRCHASATSGASFAVIHSCSCCHLLAQAATLSEPLEALAVAKRWW